MTLDEYLKNPTGKGSVYPNTEMRKHYEKVYAKLKDGFTHKLYVNRGRLLVHVMVPSDSVENIKYDVVIEFISRGNKSIRGSQFRVFSNCPSFVYTYAYAYHKKGLVLTSVQKAITE